MNPASVAPNAPIGAVTNGVTDPTQVKSFGNAHPVGGFIPGVPAYGAAPTSVMTPNGPMPLFTPNQQPYNVGKQYVMILYFIFSSHNVLYFPCVLTAAMNPHHPNGQGNNQAHHQGFMAAPSRYGVQY